MFTNLSLNKVNPIDKAHQQLGYSVTLQAIKDFFKARTEAQRNAIIKELKSDWMILISNGMSEIAAQKLLSNPDEIEARLKDKDEEEKKLLC